MTSLPRMNILYGSQTGTAEDCAERIGREAVRRHYGDVRVMSCDEFPIAEIFEESFFLFVIATTGQGDNADNTKTFFKNILRKQLQPGDFGHISFAMCGLGDSSYQKFNFSAKKIFRRLSQLGATSLLEPVYADEQHDLGVDGLIDPWLAKFWEASSHLRLDLPPLPDTLPQPKFLVTPTEGSGRPLSAPSPYRPCRVLSHKRVTSEEHFQDVRLLTVQCKDAFAPGDVAVVLPQNTPEKVDAFLRLFPTIDAEQSIKLSAGSTPLPDHLRTPTTFRSLAVSHFDLNFVPKRSFFCVYKHFCDSADADDLHWEKFDEFSRAEGQPDLIDYTVRPKRTVVEVLEDFPEITGKLQLVDLLTLIPAIRPRYYSIANSSLAHPGEVHILYAVVDFKTLLKKPRTGLCTAYLKDLQPGDAINMHLRKGTLALPENPSSHVVMVGPGTGVAPFRSFIQEIVARGGSGMTLFFGCRNEKMDFYFADEWPLLEAQGHLKVITAFSRDQDHKVYVQHRIKEHGDRLRRLVEEDACAIYVCGNAASMVGNVLEALEELLGKDKVESMQRNKEIQIEAWA